LVGWRATASSSESGLLELRGRPRQLNGLGLLYKARPLDESLQTLLHKALPRAFDCRPSDTRFAIESPQFWGVPFFFIEALIPTCCLLFSLTRRVQSS